MERQHAISMVTMARHAWQHGFVITADVYMRQALAIANRLQDSRSKALIFTIRNKMRPHVQAAQNPSPAA
ncbi:hypothetical protein [Mesorhizobium sp.]|uniref:hypothetical protein n=1 Tax=Mesorhizobium sp. TaxID=1871066 RepID=UPI000FE4D136|nr:hypothetical protein [Mesorhizobium sp.]RWP29508.1 MAG: hypothetical protein EOR03_26645 [Mesorhizobium sp.]RWP69524.1 MAG: hypothetical protein EOR07_03085 [Mesorhizobium sp.]